MGLPNISLVHPFYILCPFSTLFWKGMRATEGFNEVTELRATPLNVGASEDTANTGKGKIKAFNMISFSF